MKIRFPALAALVLPVLVLLPAGLMAHPPDAPQLEVLAAFNPAALETPESIAFDRNGNTYISLALTGEICKIAPDGTQSTFIQFPIGPPLTLCGPFFNAVTGITIDPQDDTLYASVVACDLASRGVWRVDPDGTAEILAPPCRSRASPTGSPCAADSSTWPILPSPGSGACRPAAEPRRSGSRTRSWPAICPWDCREPTA